MKTEEYIALGTLITVIASALALIIKQVESSRCTHIKCCGIDCHRTVPDDEPSRLSTPSAPDRHSATGNTPSAPPEAP